MRLTTKKILFISVSILSIGIGCLFQYNKHPLVSVIIPTYNRAYLLPRAIDSILNQSFQDFEIIIVNDGSQDKTVALLKKYQKQSEKIKVYHHDKNKGVSAARNTALKHARGKYAVLLDSDDFALPDMLKTEVEFMLNHPTFDLGIPKKTAFNFNNIEEFFEWHYDIHEFLEGNRLGNVGNIFKLDFIKKHNILYKEDQICAEDYYFWIQMIQKGAKIIKIESKEPIVAFRVHSDNNYQGNCYATSNYAKSELLKTFNIPKKMYNDKCFIYRKIIKKYPHLMKPEDIEKGSRFYCK